MRLFLIILFTAGVYLNITTCTFAQTKPISHKAISVILYEYDRYDKDGNKYLSIEPPTTELRYDCPVCKGTSFQNIRKGNNSVPVYVSCWRCNGKGYLISNTGK